jgi:CheY-like chemotaxis protein
VVARELGGRGNPLKHPAPAGAGEPGGPVAVDSDLLADFGHQLRNQLNVVVGASGLLSSKAGSSELSELAGIAQAGAEQMARLVDDVLDSIAIQAGRFELALHPFDVTASVETCLGMVADAAGSKGLDLSLSLGTDVPRVVVGDYKRLEQILMTLLHGGVLRTFRGGVGIELTSEEQGAGFALRFKVRDTGRGIPARIIRGAFDGGTALHDRFEPGDRMSILSLRTTRQLIELMHGELHIEQGGVEAGPDAGTTFEFSINVGALPAHVAQVEPTLERMRVLVVSPDASERRVLALQAQQLGATAIPASPDEALDVLRAGRPFDLALVERRPPEIDGLGFIGALRDLRRDDQLPVVLIAAETPDEAEAEATASGLIQAAITMPVEPRQLHDVMIRVGLHGDVPPPPPQPAESEAAPGTLRVLVADDNPLNQSLLRRLVASLGHRVDVVSNGLQALAAVAQHPYDAVLMDVLMPQMDGLAAAEAICRRWPRGQRPRLIALTGVVGPGDRERCLKAGYDDYMSKPVHLVDLLEAFQAAAGSRTASEPTDG